MTAVLLTAGGIYSAMQMPSSVYPEVTFPRIAVVAKVPDRDVTNMEISVTRKLEEAVMGVPGVSQVRSKTIRGGSEISINFTPGTDMKRAEQLAWNRIAAQRSELPPNTELVVEQMTPAVTPVISVVLTGGESPAKLRDYAFYQLVPQIKRIRDVQRAVVAGGDIREIEVICRPDDLLAHNLSAADVADQIGQLTPRQPVGRIENQPLAYMPIVNALPNKAAGIENLVISARNGQHVRVRDVADVNILNQDRTMSIGYAQQDAVVITVFRQQGGNVVQISRDLRALLEEQGLTLAPDDPNKKPPRNIQATVGYDDAAFVVSSVDNVRDAIVIGGLFSILILLAFLQGLRPLIICIVTMLAGLALTWLLWLAVVAMLRWFGPAGWSQYVHDARDFVLVGGVGIAFTVMGVFFWRATLISALAIPTTLAISFLFLKWTGATLNLMSLGGLAVGIGLIIDDTVVVIENIARHLEAKKPVRPAAASQPAASPNGAGPIVQPDPVDAASGEITGAVIGSTLTTVLVFVPLAFIVGVYGQFFAALSWSLSVAVLVSMVISLTLVPVFAAKFLAGQPMRSPGRFYNSVAHIYELLLARAIRYPWVTMAASLAAVFIGIVLYTGIPNPFAKRDAKGPPAPLVKGVETGLMPEMDEGAFLLDYWTPAGTPLAEAERKAREIEKVLSAHPDVESYVRRTGTEDGIFATQTSRGDIQVILRPAELDPMSLLTKPVRPPLEDLEKELKQQGKTVESEKEAIRRKYRRRALQKVMAEVEDAIKDLFSEHQLKFETIQFIEDQLNDLSGASRPVEVKLFGPDQKELRKLADDVAEVLEKKGKGRGIREVNSNVHGGNPDLMIKIDSVYADRLGLKPDAVVRQLKAIFQGQVATQVPESSLRLTDVRVRYPDSIRFGREPGAQGKGFFDRERLLGQRIMLPDITKPAGPVDTGGPLTGVMRSVPLSALGEVQAVRTPDEQYRENQQPAIFVTAELKPEEAGLGSVVADIQRWMGSEVTLPPGYRWEMGGHYIQMQQAFHSLLVVMIVAVVLVFIMLAFQFRSVLLPLLIFATQPLSLVSGMFALWITDTPLNVSSYMGAILLVGLDMKNGILLVEYIQQLRKEGMPLREALMLAGRTRFRPILMTSLAAILGLFPLALGIGPGAQMQQPLAIMVIGGLTANMLFTRVVIPVGFLLMERRKQQPAAVTTAPPPRPDGVAVVPPAPVVVPN
ncbi:MAG TPA: efflux RND transporter permease subunit [Gemmataceae bacterium]|nr:efflux RND transporter permease subunit [Gemmataceae bacterium]